MPRISGKTLDERVNEVWRRLHVSEERAYYAPVSSAIGSTLSRDVRPGFALMRRVRVEGELL